MSKFNLEKETLVRAKNGDKECIEKVIKSNLEFVYTISRTVKLNSQTDFDDLVSQGIVGILKALKKYNTDKNIRFLTYAYFYIKSEIYNYSNNTAFCVKLSNSKLREYLKLRKEEKENNHTSSKLKEFDSFKQSNVISFQKSEIDYPTIDKNFNDTENKIHFEHLMESCNLTSKEAFIINEIFSNQLTIKAVSKKLGLSASHITKTKKIALAKIKQTLFERRVV